MSPITSQILGISLAIITALGCLAYERLVKVFPYWFIGVLVSMHYIPFWLGSMYFQKREIPSLRENWISIAVLMISGVTGPIWYFVTRKQGLLVSSMYEIKYVAILAIFYILFGEHKVTGYTLAGVLLGMSSIWCLSHSK